MGAAPLPQYGPGTARTGLLPSTTRVRTSATESPPQRYLQIPALARVCLRTPIRPRPRCVTAQGGEGHKLRRIDGLEGHPEERSACASTAGLPPRWVPLRVPSFVWRVRSRRRPLTCKNACSIGIQGCRYRHPEMLISASQGADMSTLGCRYMSSVVMSPVVIEGIAPFFRRPMAT